MIKYEFFLSSALEKVMPTQRPAAMASGAALSIWPGEKAAVQLVYTAQNGTAFMPQQLYRIEITGAPWAASFSQVDLMGAGLPCYEQSDEDYISKAPGLYPDLLTPMPEPLVLPISRQYRSVWIRWNIPEDAVPGNYPITIWATPVEQYKIPNGDIFHDPDVQSQVFSLSLTLKIGATRLLPQSLIHTEWFHTDCLAQYYGVPIFSEDYWRITENFIRSAGEDHGINMLLTPVFTPPLDTPVNSERPTVQLVDIYEEAGCYRFNFQNLARWTQLCRAHGITYLEIPHLFTQWGAQATPKIIATVDGVEQQVFGWFVPADSSDYRKFLEAFLPALRHELTQLGYDQEHVYFHISDEPSPEHLENYHTALGQASDLLEGCPILDALSSYDFYRQGLVRIPVCADDHIQPFADAQVPNLWVYYCCVQGDRVPNRFFAMPSYRNRIMGVLVYLYNIQGFLHWGFNFYNSKYSLHTIDPFRCADGDLGFPAGDPFLVYPGPDKNPISSIRAEVQDDALLDLRALQTLEALTSRDHVEELIHTLAGTETITFTDYPRDPAFTLALREEVARQITELSAREARFKQN